MKKILILAATLIIAVCFISCRDKSKMENSDRTLYAQDLTDALSLEASVPMEVPVVSVPDAFGDLEFNLANEDLWIYKGKVGDLYATFRFTLDWDKVSDGQICGYVMYEPEDVPLENPVAGLKIASNQPDPNGFNRVIFEALSPSGELLGTFTGIVEGRGDGFKGEYKKAGEGNNQVPFESMRQY